MMGCLTNALVRLQVCAKAGLEPSAVSYIEAHGTGTVAGDGQELGALEEWYGRTGGRCGTFPVTCHGLRTCMLRSPARQERFIALLGWRCALRGAACSCMGRFCANQGCLNVGESLGA